MDFNYIEEFDEGVVIKDVRNFELAHIFECGQCFRWNKQENGNYIGVAYGKVIEVEKKGNDVILYNVNKEEFDNIWSDYFDLYRDYAIIKEALSKDNILKKSVEFGEGIRLLQQEPFELTISFIISANNRIPMIKKCIDKISERWGKAIEYKNKIYYSFPTVEELKDIDIEEVEKCGTGFRAKYIVDTVKKIYSCNISNLDTSDQMSENKYEYNLDWIKKQNDDITHKELQKFSGIGPKVADCIMLFSMQKNTAFPVDVWVKRAMQYFYLAPDVSLPKIREFARNKFGELSGFAQQYLFYYARENNIRID